LLKAGFRSGRLEAARYVRHGCLTLRVGGCAKLRPHQRELLEDWERLQAGQAPQPITPLA